MQGCLRQFIGALQGHCFRSNASNILDLGHDWNFNLSLFKCLPKQNNWKIYYQTLVTNIFCIFADKDALHSLAALICLGTWDIILLAF